MILVVGVAEGRAQSYNQQVETAWNSLRNMACDNARTATQTAEAAAKQHDAMEQAVQQVPTLQSVPEDVARDTTRSMKDALRDMRGIARDVRSISQDMKRICSEDIRLRNSRDAAKKYDDRSQTINAAVNRYNALVEEYGETIRQFNEAAIVLTMHGSTLNQLETE
ncbi:MAG: hypothetical protein ACOCWR_04515 [Oceanidesulfovibrio sp.]